MKKILSLFILQLFIVSVFSQDIHKSSALVLPETGDYIVSENQSVKITSGVSVTLLPNVHLKAGSNVTIKISNAPVIPPPPANPSEDANMNWVMNKVYDEEGNLVGTSKSFFDNNGKPLQSQVKNLSTGHILASQPVYDAQDRAALSTLPAPTNNSEFKYLPTFISNTSGEAYNYKNFEDPGNTNDPNLKRNNADPVANGTIGTLGWYYSDNNTFESHVATTSYPYSRTEFFDDGTGVAKRSAATGDELRMGKGHEVSSNSFAVLNELDFYKTVRDKYFLSVAGSSESFRGKGIQSYSRDENGLEGVTITDLSGKLLMSARAGINEEVLSVSNSVDLSNKTGYIYTFAGSDAVSGSYAKNLVLEGKGTVKVYESTDGGTTYTEMYNGEASGYVSPSSITSLYKIESDQVFYLSYEDNTSSKFCDDCEAQVASFGKKQVHYFKLFKPTSVTVTGSDCKIYNMSGDEKEMSFSSGDILPAGYYRAAVLGTGSTTVSYTNKYADISFNFYDQLGQLVATIAPEGVKKLVASIGSYAAVDNVPYLTLNEYDLQGRLVKVKETDAGISEFVYRTDGNIRFSQNSEQKKPKPDVYKERFSYTNYDRWGRPIESGEYVTPQNSSLTFAGIRTDEAVLEATGSSADIAGLTKNNSVKTHYDLPDHSHALAGYVQDELYLKAGVSQTENQHAKTWYNYDSYGRVTWLIKEITGLGKKTINYTYDGKGNVVKVEYQKNTDIERFIHEYEYDSDSRLKVVYTAAGTGAKKEQARYYYYLHGPLKRVELAENLQGIDYAYTPQGWLKSINHPETAKDPGKDGSNGFASDAFGMTLEYFNGDYTRNNTNIASLNAGTNKTYFNGTIRAQSWRSNKPQPIVNSNTGINNPAMFTYEYDDKYQLDNNKYGTPDFSSNSFTVAVDKGREHGLGYDANGNIGNLVRTKTDGTIANKFKYNYFDNTNKLSSVTNVDANTDYASYSYDDLGQMVSQTKGTTGIYLDYDVSGKVTAIYSDAGRTQLKVSFVYDESGMRILKKDHTRSPALTTYYVYDASGNVLSVYDNNGSTTVQQKEIPVYASGRIGTYSTQSNSYQYELTDHLGNVRVVINQSKTSTGQADVVYYSDYYPFGSPMTLANSDYRYGYQGQYAEVDKETGWMKFMLRMYDPVIGRWLTTDPYGEFYSPYVGMANSPINTTDPDGGCTECPKNGKVGDTYNTGGASYTNLADGGWTRTGNFLNEVVIKGKYTTGSDFNNWGANFMTAAGMTRDWAFGQGDETRRFNNDRVANALRNADVVNQARNYWYAKVNKPGNTIYDDVTNFKGKQRLGGGNFGLVGLAKAGVDPIEQFVGSFTPEISSNGIDLTFTIKNTTSFKSLMYGIAPEWARATLQPGGNMYQVYTFREPIMFNKIRRFN